MSSDIWNPDYKPRAKPHNPVFRNTFGQNKKKWLKASTVFAGLKVGMFKWEKLPKEVQDGVRAYLDSKEFKETLV